MHILIDDVLRTGRWGPLALPADRAAVRAALGAPDTFMGSSESTAAIWRYGVIECHFFDDDCWMVFTDDINDIEEPSRAFSVSAGLLTAGTALTPAAAERALSAAGTGSRRVDRGRDEVLLATDAGVALQFQPTLSAIWIGDPDFCPYLFTS